MRDIFLLTLVALVLTACQSVPIERKSPCVCKWQPVNEQNERAIT